MVPEGGDNDDEDDSWKGGECLLAGHCANVMCVEARRRTHLGLFDRWGVNYVVEYSLA